MASPFGDSRGNPATPDQLREAPRDGEDIPMKQLWVLSLWGRTSLVRTRAPVFSSDEPAEEGHPWEFREEFDFESSYCEEVQAQIAQAEKQVAGEE